MNNVEKFYKYGSLTLNVGFKPIEGRPILYVDKGSWYKFIIDSVEELDDESFNITTTKLIGIDDINIIE